jgi:hypothetical protein
MFLDSIHFFYYYYYYSFHKNNEVHKVLHAFSDFYVVHPAERFLRDLCEYLVKE